MIGSSKCPSHEEINTLRRNAKHLLEEISYIKPCSCGGAGWTRVAYFNMSNSQQTCPSNWNFMPSPVRGDVDILVLILTFVTV